MDRNGDPQWIAAQCRHYAMCKIDFLGTGICPPAKKRYYLGYFPQGRMDIYHALMEGKIPVTRGLVDIADSCELCGICDKQCYFVAQLRPMKVARALKNYVSGFLSSNKPIEVKSDSVLEKLQSIVGLEWASRDPAHLVPYANDPSPVSKATMPRYVALPQNTSQVQEVVRLCRAEDIPVVVRGNGSSVMGFVLTSGLVMDTIRMKELDFDQGNWCVKVGPGVTSFELQKAASGKGFRVNAAEPAASYCANIMCSGIFSLFSARYGTGADNFIDAEFVDPEGEVFRLSEKDSPNLYAFEKGDFPQPGICTRVTARLYPVFEDESALAIPFAKLKTALEFARDLARRHIGNGIGVLGGEYLSTFTAPTKELARKVKLVFKQDLGIEYLVLVLGDQYDLSAVRKMATVVLDKNLLRILILGMPNLADTDWAQILRGMEGDSPPYELLGRPEIRELLELALDPGPATWASAVDQDIRSFFTDLYSRPEMTDIMWLNDFRIISSRMGRDGHVVAFIVYLPLDDPGPVIEIDQAFTALVSRFGIRGDFGFLTPLDGGKRAVLEWDFYLDHTDPNQVKKMQQAMAATGEMIEKFSAGDPRILWIRYLFNQGFSRKESFLYRSAVTE
jgi:hypothetical protein